MDSGFSDSARSQNQLAFRKNRVLVARLNWASRWLVVYREKERDVRMCSKKNKHLQALTLFERGYGYKATASELNLNTETVREWLYTWKALGSDLYKHPEKRPHPIRRKLNWRQWRIDKRASQLLRWWSAIKLRIVIESRNGATCIHTMVRRPLRITWIHRLYLLSPAGIFKPTVHTLALA